LTPCSTAFVVEHEHDYLRHSAATLMLGANVTSVSFEDDNEARTACLDLRVEERRATVEGALVDGISERVAKTRVFAT
jgi:hypothetical protein